MRHNWWKIVFFYSKKIESWKTIHRLWGLNCYVVLRLRENMNLLIGWEKISLGKWIFMIYYIASRNSWRVAGSYLYFRALIEFLNKSSTVGLPQITNPDVILLNRFSKHLFFFFVWILRWFNFSRLNEWFFYYRIMECFFNG